ncbi:MAG TPA: HTH domain-containing protein, partial [Sphaerochaeta sp.]|nr:HTH domain-containing protein [Sphaerochaeta sp.]
TEKKVLELLVKNSDMIADELADAIGVSERTIQRAYASLQKNGYLERIGSKKSGKWIVLK